MKQKVLLTLSYEVVDREGKVIRKGKKKCDSFVKNYGLIQTVMGSGNTQDIVDTGGTTRTIKDTLDYDTGWCNSWGGLWPFFDLTAIQDQDDRGILIGSSNTPVSPDDFKLGSKFSNSTMECQTQNYSYSIGEDTGEFTISRGFLNMTSSDIIAEESAIYIRYVNYYFMIVRDLLPSISVDPGQTLNLTYQFTYYW